MSLVDLAWGQAHETEQQQLQRMRREKWWLAYHSFMTFAQHQPMHHVGASETAQAATRHANEVIKAFDAFVKGQACPACGGAKETP